MFDKIRQVYQDYARQKDFSPPKGETKTGKFFKALFSKQGSPSLPGEPETYSQESPWSTKKVTRDPKATKTRTTPVAAVANSTINPIAKDRVQVYIKLEKGQYEAKNIALAEKIVDKNKELSFTNIEKLLNADETLLQFVNATDPSQIETTLEIYAFVKENYGEDINKIDVCVTLHNKPKIYKTLKDNPKLITFSEELDPKRRREFVNFVTGNESVQNLLKQEGILDHLKGKDPKSVIAFLKSVSKNPKTLKLLTDRLHLLSFPENTKLSEIKSLLDYLVKNNSSEEILDFGKLVPPDTVYEKGVFEENLNKTTPGEVIKLLKLLTENKHIQKIYSENPQLISICLKKVPTKQQIKFLKDITKHKKVRKFLENEGLFLLKQVQTEKAYLETQKKPEITENLRDLIINIGHWPKASTEYTINYFKDWKINDSTSLKEKMNLLSTIRSDSRRNDLVESKAKPFFKNLDFKSLQELQTSITYEPAYAPFIKANLDFIAELDNPHVFDLLNEIFDSTGGFISTGDHRESWENNQLQMIVHYNLHAGSTKEETLDAAKNFLKLKTIPQPSTNEEKMATLLYNKGVVNPYGTGDSRLELVKKFPDGALSNDVLKQLFDCSVDEVDKITEFVNLNKEFTPRTLKFALLLFKNTGNAPFPKEMRIRGESHLSIPSNFGSLDKVLTLMKDISNINEKHQFLLKYAKVKRGIHNKESKEHLLTALNEIPGQLEHPNRTYIEGIIDLTDCTAFPAPVTQEIQDLLISLARKNESTLFQIFFSLKTSGKALKLDEIRDLMMAEENEEIQDQIGKDGYTKCKEHLERLNKTPFTTEEKITFLKEFIAYEKEGVEIPVEDLNTIFAVGSDNLDQLLVRLKAKLAPTKLDPNRHQLRKEKKEKVRAKKQELLEKHKRQQILIDAASRLEKSEPKQQEKAIKEINTDQTGSNVEEDTATTQKLENAEVSAEVYPMSDEEKIDIFNRADNTNDKVFFALNLFEIYKTDTREHILKKVQDKKGDALIDAIAQEIRIDVARYDEGYEEKTINARVAMLKGEEVQEAQQEETPQTGQTPVTGTSRPPSLPEISLENKNILRYLLDAAGIRNSATQDKLLKEFTPLHFKQKIHVEKLKELIADSKYDYLLDDEEDLEDIKQDIDDAWAKHNKPSTKDSEVQGATHQDEVAGSRSVRETTPKQLTQIRETVAKLLQDDTIEDDNVLFALNEILQENDLEKAKQLLKNFNSKSYGTDDSEEDQVSGYSESDNEIATEEPLETFTETEQTSDNEPKEDSDQKANIVTKETPKPQNSDPKASVDSPKEPQTEKEMRDRLKDLWKNPPPAQTNKKEEIVTKETAKSQADSDRDNPVLKNIRHYAKTYREHVMEPNNRAPEMRQKLQAKDGKDLKILEQLEQAESMEKAKELLDMLHADIRTALNDYFMDMTK